MATEATRVTELLVDGPAWENKTYLNTAAEGLLLNECVQGVHRYLRDKSTGEPGRVGMWQAHGQARELAGKLFSVPTNNIALVSSTTEALNTVAQGFNFRPGDEVVFTSVEFPSNLCPWVALTDKGIKTRIVKPRNGLVSMDELLEQINPRTRLVTVSQVSYATGQHLDPGPIWERVKNTSTLLCVDATQAAGRVSVRGDQADFVVASTFKWLNSIHGAAILSVGPRVFASDIRGPAGWLSAESVYAPDRLEKFHPRNDAGRFHAGMPNFDSVYSLAASLAFHTPERVARRRQDLEPLVAQTRVGLEKLKLPILTPPEPKDRAGIVAFTCPQAVEVKKRLAEKSIHIHADDGRVRAALHWYTTPAQVERYLAALGDLAREGLLVG